MKKALLLVLLAPGVVLADDVILKSGGKISGRIVQRTATAVDVDVGAGTVSISMDRVERIDESRSALDEYYARAGDLPPQDHEGWLELARWASAQGLSAQAREAYHRVLAVDPMHGEANRALGNVLVDGRWVSEDESYRAQGLVQYEGEWMTPGQRDALEGARQAQSDAEWAQAEADAQARAAEAEAQAAAAQDDEDEDASVWWGGWGPAARRRPLRQARPQ